MATKAAAKKDEAAEAPKKESKSKYTYLDLSEDDPPEKRQGLYQVLQEFQNYLGMGANVPPLEWLTESLKAGHPLDHDYLND